MKLALTGLPTCGKTTLFSALTQRKMSAGGRETSDLALLPVPDERVDKLSAMYNPKKTTYAQVTFQDPPAPLFKADDPTTKLPPELRQADGLVEVVRNFDGGFGAPKPAQDHHSLLEEMILNDLITLERRIERIEGEKKRGREIDKEELALCQQALALVEAETPLRSQPELAGHHKLRGFGLLSAKPLLVVANNADEDPESPTLGTDEEVLVVRASIEAELADLPEDERGEFMADLGLTGSTLDRLIAASYRALNLISFFTVGEDEVRAWTVAAGSTAPVAAGVIHSDLQKGFIRAEIMSYHDLMEHRSEQALKKAGLFKVVGKDHVVSDGEILHVRFNV